MKTALDILSKHSERYGAIVHIAGEIVRASEALAAMEEYAHEAIKADRENVVKHAKTRITNVQITNKS